MGDAMHDHRQCLALFSKISEYLDNEVDEATRRTIKRHLKRCKPCQVCLRTLERTVALCGTLDTLPVPKNFSHRLHRMFLQK